MRFAKDPALPQGFDEDFNGILECFLCKVFEDPEVLCKNEKVLISYKILKNIIENTFFVDTRLRHRQRPFEKCFTRIELISGDD